jgi:hypothetical protein
MLFLLVLERDGWRLVSRVVSRVLSLLVSVMSLWVVLCHDLQAVKVLVSHKYPPLLPPLPSRPQSLLDSRLLPVEGPPQVRRGQMTHPQTLHLPLQIDHHRKYPRRQSLPPRLILLLF